MGTLARPARSMTASFPVLHAKRVSSQGADEAKSFLTSAAKIYEKRVSYQRERH